MQDTFITGIHINKVRHLTNIDIALSETERKHLILTGKNGSGKTSLLKAIRGYVILQQRLTIGSTIRSYEDRIEHTLYDEFAREESPFISVSFFGDINNYYDFTFAYFSAERSDLTIPKSIEAFDMWGKTVITRNASKDFLNYVLNLYVQYLSAKDTNRPIAEIQQYKSWFDRFTQALREIYKCKELELIPDMKNLKFNVIMPGREPFALHEMSDGYKAFFEIMFELLIRMENGGGIVEYDKPAIVLVDEIETHLHIELQKRALPFLTRMFPNVQFIVSTHSPFVITSLPNAMVYDLEKHEQLDNPSFYSYEAVVESFLDSDMYSDEMKRLLARYKELCFKPGRTEDENEEFLRIKTELELMSPASKELFIAFLTLEQQRKEVMNDQTR